MLGFTLCVVYSMRFDKYITYTGIHHYSFKKSNIFTAKKPTVLHLLTPLTLPSFKPLGTIGLYLHFWPFLTAMYCSHTVGSVLRLDSFT